MTIVDVTIPTATYDGTTVLSRVMKEEEVEDFESVELSVKRELMTFSASAGFVYLRFSERLTMSIVPSAESTR